MYKQIVRPNPITGHISVKPATNMLVACVNEALCPSFIIISLLFRYDQQLIQQIDKYPDEAPCQSVRNKFIFLTITFTISCLSSFYDHNFGCGLRHTIVLYSTYLLQGCRCVPLVYPCVHSHSAVVLSPLPNPWDQHHSAAYIITLSDQPMQIFRYQDVSQNTVSMI